MGEKVKISVVRNGEVLREVETTYGDLAGWIKSFIKGGWNDFNIEEIEK